MTISTSGLIANNYRRQHSLSSLQVSELKQLNRLISDQEVYGLRTIRVPVKRYGLVEELIRSEMEKEQANVKLGNGILCWFGVGIMCKCMKFGKGNARFFLTLWPVVNVK